MINRFLNFGLAAALLAAAATASSCRRQQEAPTDTARIELLSNSWDIHLPAKAAAQLDSAVSHAPLPAADSIEKGFAIAFTADLQRPTADRHILEIPGAVDVCLRQHNPLDRDKQNYPAYKMPDGTVPVLEAAIDLVLPVDGKTERMTVGIPLAILDEPYGQHRVVLNFTGTRWTMYVDGRLLDNDFPLGYPTTQKMTEWKIDPQFVSEAAVYYPAAEPVRAAVTSGEPQPQLQYWTPRGHNSWVGDVVSIVHDGTYHLFYLYDRRGHQSKFGRGGHYFEHLSTRDFRHWKEHEAAVPIDEQWETFGTGTPFVWDGRLCLSYGYHSTRIYPYEQTALPEQYAYLEKEGHTGSFDRHELQGIPAGSSYSISDDGGDHFLKTGRLFHPCENPGIYTDHQGRLRLLASYGARGTWASDTVGGGWHCIDADFPPGGDCTFFFSMGGRDYIVGGFTGLWAKKSTEPDSAYRDIAAEAGDFYNGLCVPTVATIPDGRCLAAGWTWLRAWGGALVIHELVSLPGGALGTRWMPELVPALSSEVTTLPGCAPGGTVAAALPSPSFLLSFEVTPTHPGAGHLAVELLPKEDCGEQDACCWSLDCGEDRAQYSGRGDMRQPTLHEGGSPQQGRDYAIENVPGTGGSFAVRMLVKASEKFGGTLLDTEIGRQRTMLSYRERLRPARLRLSADSLALSDITITPLAE